MIPYTQHEITEEDISVAVDLLRSNKPITRGSYTEMLEEAIGERYGGYCVMLSSGTAALHTAVLGFTGGFPGRRILSPTLTFSAIGNAALFSIGKLELLDVDNEKLHSLKPLGRGNIFVPMDYAGLPWRDKADHVVIRDAAHSFGALYAPTDAIVFSFHPAKHITGGEGGAVVVYDKEAANQIKLFRNNGLDASHAHTRMGLNYHIDEISAAILWSQLQRINQIIQRRREIAKYYLDQWATESRLQLPTNRADHVWHIFVLRVNGINRNEFRSQLRVRGIGTQIHYTPLHKQPLFLSNKPFHNADDAWNRMVTIPLYPSMTDEQVEYVVRSVNEALDAVTTSAS